MKKAGVVGKKSVVKASIPLWIRYGNRNLQASYLRQVVDDEGTIGEHDITYTRAIDVSEHIKNLQTDQIDYLENKINWKITKGSVRRTKHYVSLNEGTVNQFRKSGIGSAIGGPPRPLIEEKEILRDVFGISVHVYPKELYKTKRGYSVTWRLAISGRENIRKFREKIGLSLRRKEEKLRTIAPF